jgi:hypothetical protein
VLIDFEPFICADGYGKRWQRRKSHALGSHQLETRIKARQGV